MSVESITRRRLLAAFGSAGILLAAPGWALPKKKPGKPLNVALAGLGSYASEQLAPGLALTKHCRLAGIVTGTPAKIPQWQAKYGIADRNVYNYENFDRIADNDDIDVVYIVTPTHLHAPLTLRAAAAGKHVWCEKPMAMHAGECEAMIAACKRNKVALTIGYRMQHEPNTRRLIAMASEKPFGAMQRVRAEAGYNGYHDATKADRPWRLRSQFGGGAMYDMGVYPLNAARYTVGSEPLAVTAKRWTDRPELFDEVDEHMDFTLEFPNAVRAECKTSFGNNMNVLRAECERGWYELSPFQSYQGVTGKASDGRVFDAKVRHQQALQMDEDALAIINGTPLRAPGEEGLRDIRIVDAIYRSAREGSKRIVL
ncbi:Gfo/Idh/MocA family protein [Xanthomonas arboricola]|uniref:Gfo/Idh/MocA family protein n=1 Tax=Xanthomonas arboricola TaxID=56448 RepID=UPI000CEDA37B|nr:Gfo/Idh/MocA family oxidoreductase [Xanthomonas arboricola]MBB5859326.1 glucose-fructose oxidoreductase [Xanthomonas arboricola]PPT56577.1 glucose-fructose oxidoreductase [Xanthomonas arboricola]